MKVKISLLALFAVVMLSACGQQNETATGASSETTTGTATEASTETTAPKEETEQPTTDQASDSTADASAQQSDFANALVDFVPSLTDDQGQLQQVTYDFIAAHPNLFPAKESADRQEANKLVDSSVTSRHLFKNVNPYLDKMVTVKGSTIEVNEDESPLGTVAFVHIMDEYDNSVTGVYLGSTGDLLDGDEVTLRGVPVTTYSFDNVGGGTTNAVLLALSTVQKEQ